VTPPRATFAPPVVGAGLDNAEIEGGPRRAAAAVARGEAAAECGGGGATNARRARASLRMSSLRAEKSTFLLGREKSIHGTMDVSTARPPSTASSLLMRFMTSAPHCFREVRPTGVEAVGAAWRTVHGARAASVLVVVTARGHHAPSTDRAARAPRSRSWRGEKRDVRAPRAPQRPILARSSSSMPVEVAPRPAATACSVRVQQILFRFKSVRMSRFEYFGLDAAREEVALAALRWSVRSGPRRTCATCA